MAKNEKPGHRTSADFAGSDHLDRHPREVHGQPWEAGNWHIGRRQELAVDVRPTLLVVEHYAEYLQSEAKEINLRVGLKAYGAGTAGAITLKSLNSDAVAQPNFASSVTSQAAQQPSPASSGRLIKVGCKAQRGMACTSFGKYRKGSGIPSGSHKTAV